jgi:guanylate kinase
MDCENGSVVLFMIKPNVPRAFRDRIFAAIRNKGFDIIAKKVVKLTVEQAVKHYEEKAKEKGFPFEELISYTCRGHVILIFAYSYNAVANALSLRKLIREEYTSAPRFNSIHCSASDKEAIGELKHMFPEYWTGRLQYTTFTRTHFEHNSHHTPLVVVLVGTTGAGKTTIANNLEMFGDKVSALVSCTTRALRENEKEGVDYYFCDKKEFNAENLETEFIEWDKYPDNENGNYYGLKYKTLWATSKGGTRPVVVVMSTQGALSVSIGMRALIMNPLFIFIDANNEDLVKRMEARGWGHIQIAERMARAEKDRQFYLDNESMFSACISTSGVSIEQTVARVSKEAQDEFGDNYDYTDFLSDDDFGVNYE